MKRGLLIAGVMISGLLTPLSLLPALFLVNSVNPMQLAFVTSFRVTNHSGKTLDVIPVGTFNSGRKGVLPTFAWGFPAVPRLSRAPYQISHGDSRKILFDWDDINFSELVVRDESGEYRQFVTDPNPPTKDYYAPRQKHFTVPDFAELEPVDRAVLAAVNRKGNFLQSWWTILGLALPPFFLFGVSLALCRERRRSRIAEQSPGTYSSKAADGLTGNAQE